MALAMNAHTAVATSVPAHAVSGISSFKQATSVRFTNGKYLTLDALIGFRCHRHGHVGYVNSFCEIEISCIMIGKSFHLLGCMYENVHVEFRSCTFHILKLLFAESFGS